MTHPHPTPLKLSMPRKARSYYDPSNAGSHKPSGWLEEYTTCHLSATLPAPEVVSVFATCSSQSPGKALVCLVSTQCICMVIDPSHTYQVPEAWHTKKIYRPSLLNQGWLIQELTEREGDIYAARRAWIALPRGVEGGAVLYKYIRAPTIRAHSGAVSLMPSLSLFI